MVFHHVLFYIITLPDYEMQHHSHKLFVIAVNIYLSSTSEPWHYLFRECRPVLSTEDFYSTGKPCYICFTLWSILLNIGAKWQRNKSLPLDFRGLWPNFTCTISRMWFTSGHVTTQHPAFPEIQATDITCVCIYEYILNEQDKIMSPMPWLDVQLLIWVYI